MRWLVLAVLLVGCAHNVNAAYPGEGGVGTGTLVLLLSDSASDVNVAINGRLVVVDEHTEYIEITGVPVGEVEIVMTANGGDKAMRVWVNSEYPTTVPMGVPDMTPSFLKSIAGSLITLLVYSWLH